LLRRFEALENEDESARTWILIGLGLLGWSLVMEAASGDVNTTLVRELAPLWAGLNEGWRAGAKQERLAFVSRQTFRVNFA
jgi:hypothetical protein